MHVVIADRPGPPSVLALVERPDPEPAPEQVRVRVDTAAVTFVDTLIRSGATGHAFPYRPGNGVTGLVDALGTGVETSWAGTRVVTSTGGAGGYATDVVAAASDLHRVPPGLDPDDAVALLADGRTAVGLCSAGAVAPGETVVVTAAAGGVGTLLIQLCVARGARVVALARSARKLEVATRLGAAVALDYTAPGWAAGLAPDVVFDGVGGVVGTTLAARVRVGGRYVPHGFASGAWADVDEAEMSTRGVVTVPLASVGDDPDGLHALVEQALALGARGALRPLVGQAFPLAEAADAHALIEARGTIGKTVLRT